MTHSFRGVLILAGVLSLVACERESESFLEIKRERRVVQMPPIAPEESVGIKQVTDTLFEARYVVNPSVFRSAAPTVGDPFRDPVPVTVDEPKSVAGEFERAGITFGEGTSAKYHFKSGILLVVQTRDQLELIEAYIDGGCNLQEKEIQVRFEIYRLPRLGGLEALDSASAQDDHTPERFAVLQAAREGKASLLAAPAIQCRSGQRAKVSEVKVGSVKESDHVDEDVSAEESVLPDKNILIELEVDPVLGADELIIDINSALVFRSEDRPEVERSLTAQTSLHDGSWKLVGTWNVGSNEMMLIFLNANVARIGDYGALVAPETLAP
jgi:hypothetical protein